MRCTTKTRLVVVSGVSMHRRKICIMRNFGGYICGTYVRHLWKYVTFSATFNPHLRLQSHMRIFRIMRPKTVRIFNKMHVQKLNIYICHYKTEAYAFSAYIRDATVFSQSAVCGKYADLIRICDRFYSQNAYTNATVLRYSSKL